MTALGRHAMELGNVKMVSTAILAYAIQDLLTKTAKQVSEKLQSVLVLFADVLYFFRHR